MAVECFSWCSWIVRWPFKNIVKKRKSTEDLLAPQRPIMPQQTSDEELRSDSKEKLANTGRVVVPMKYVTASVKETLTILNSAAGLIPVPMLQDAITLSLKIIELCEEAPSVESKAKDLQDRVGHLMVIILAHVTDRSEDGDNEVILKAAQGMEDDIKELLNTLGSINRDLAEVKAQNRWVLTFYKDINTGTLDSCIDRLSFSLERFKLANDLRDSDLLEILHGRFTNMAKRVDGISKDMKHVVVTVDNIQSSMDSTREAFDEVLSRVKRSATVLSSTTMIRQLMPLKPEIFYGRYGLVQDIVQLLVTEETSRVCIMGPGGMGKTSVSLAVVESALVQEQFRRGRIVWVPCIGATSAALLLEVLYVQLEITGDKQVTLEKIFTELSRSDTPHLLLFDNFETPWNTLGSQKEVEDILRQLARLERVAILVTMRGKYAPCDHAIRWQSRNISPTDEEASLRIFHEIHPSSKDDPNVGRLLQALGYMPFAVTLMASLGKEGQSTAEELLQAWAESGPDIISDSPEKSMNRSISLSVESPRVQQNSNAVLLLSILSLLPEGTTKENLHWWAPMLKGSMNPSAIATLSNAALLLESKRQDSDSPVLFVVPVVQSFMQLHDRVPSEVRKQIRDSCCQYVLDHACRFDEPDFNLKSMKLAAEDSNIQAILFSSMSLSPRTMEAMIAFCWYRCDTKPSPDIAQHALAAAEALGVEKYIALAAWCLGRTYYLVNAKLLSFEHLQKAYQLFSTSSDPQSRKSCVNCGVNLVDSATFVLKDDKEIIRLAHEVEEKSAALADNCIHGRSLVIVGMALEHAGQAQNALQYLNRAKVMLENAGSVLDLIETCQMLGRRLPEALDALEEGWKHAEMTDIPYLQAIASSDLAKALFSANRDADAMKFVEIALTKTTYLGNQLQVAIALEYMGYGYLRRGDYQNACSAYESAADTYLLKITDNASWERCKDNLSRIELKLDKPNEVVGFVRPFWDPDKSLFYLPVHSSAALPISSA